MRSIKMSNCRQLQENLFISLIRTITKTILIRVIKMLLLVSLVFYVVITFQILMFGNS